MITQSTSSSPAVVVGVDGSPGALWAVRWAAVEAAGRGMPLRLVFAVDPECEAGVDRTDLRDRRVAENVLAEAVHQARVAHASVDVAAEVVHASPGAALARGAGRAAMICLGSNGVRPAHPGHRTSTATEVVLTADCPVAVVRGPVLRHGWVVARIDADPSLFDVFHLAVTEALLRSLPLRLLTAWTVRSAAPADFGADVDRRLRRELDSWRQRYSHLDAVVVTAPNLDDFLSRNARRVALFVAPQRQTHDVGTVVHPSVETAIRLLDCPVLIGGGVPGPFCPNAAPMTGATTQLFP